MLVYRTVPIVSLPVSGSSMLVRGMICEWNSGSQTVEPWLSATNDAFGVASDNVDQRLETIDVYLGKGCSMQIKCDADVIPNPGDYLYWSAPGVVTNIGSGQAFARAIGEGEDGFIEAVLL